MFSNKYKLIEKKLDYKKMEEHYYIKINFINRYLEYIILKMKELNHQKLVDTQIKDESKKFEDVKKLDDSNIVP